MDFGFSPEQDMLRDSAQRFLDQACPSSLVRRAMEDPSAHPAELWEQLAALGWLGILVPQTYGGQGGSLLDAIVLLEEMGKVLLPGPFASTVLLGSTTLLLGGTPTQQAGLLPELAQGVRLFTTAVAEAAGRYDAAGITLPARCAGSNFTLNGEKWFVPDAHVADWLFVAARTTPSSDPEAGITLFTVPADRPGLRVTQHRTVDQSRRLCQVAFDDVVVSPADIIGAVDQGWPLLVRVLDHATVGCCVEMVGTAQRALDLTVEYVKERRQFDRPIGSFQAVKHRLVDMLVQVENARSLCYWAAWAVAEDAVEAARAVAMAKAYCSDMCKSVCSEAIQLHGGIGFTWEHDLHLFYRRALAGEAAFGNAPVHRERVARLLAP